MSDIATTPRIHADERLTIELKGVRKCYGDHVVLDGIDLTIAPGQTVALIGPSGGGKSTLLRCLNGLCSFDSGTVRVGPHTMTADDVKNSTSTVMAVRRMLGMVFQDFQLFPHMTALANVMEAQVQVLRRTRREAQERALELLREVGLVDHANKYPDMLSGGQKQRVALARAVAMDPHGLLCDEITSALDPEMKHEVLEVLQKLDVDGQTLIMVTHEIGFARRAADRVIVLEGGRIIEDGPPAQVIDNPKTERTRQFLSRVMG
jgi:ABC-type polar amino acid transport system ATPase subunit